MNILSTPGFTLTELTEFVDYVLSFYGNGGIYDKGMSRDDVIKGLNILTTNENNAYEEFGADSMDREIIGELFDNNFVAQEDSLADLPAGTVISLTLPDGTVKSEVIS